MPFVLGLVIAIAVGLLAVFVVTWTGRFTGATKRQYSHLFAAVRPIAREAGAQANASQAESQVLEAWPQHTVDTGLKCNDVAAAPREFVRGLCPEPPKMPASKVELYPGRALFWMTSHDLMATSRSASGPTHHEDSVWKVITFVCHMPRLSVEERQRLLTAWSNRHHAG